MPKRLVVKLSDELYSKLKKHVVEQHGKIKGELSKTVQEMIEECLDKRERETNEVVGEERYREIVELAPDMIAIHQDGKFVYINEAGTKMLGAKSADELIGKDVLSFTTPEWRKILEERVHMVIEDNIQTTRLRLPILRLDGSTIEGEIITGIRVTYHGKPAIQNWIKDISAMKRAEKTSWDSLSYV